MLSGTEAGAEYSWGSLDGSAQVTPGKDEKLTGGLKHFLEALDLHLQLSDAAVRVLIDNSLNMKNEERNKHQPCS